MTSAGAMAFAAAGAGLAGAWELLSAVERVRLSGWLRRLLAPLRRAGEEGRIPSTAEQRKLAALSAGVLLAGGWIVGGTLFGVLLAFAGPSIALAVVRARRRRYVAAVHSGAASCARALAAALSAGRSVRAAVTDAARDVQGPAGHELRVAARAIEVGAPTDAVLEDLRRRAGGGPWDTLVAALLLQRDAGGDLAGLLRGLAGSLEAAARADRDARAATAQSRATAWIVAGLPLCAAAVAELGSPGFLAGLVGHPISAVLTILAVLLQAIAIVWIRVLVR